MSIHFDAVDDEMSTSANVGISGTANISYGCWLKTINIDASNHHLFNIGVATANNMSHMILISGVIKFGAWTFDTTSNTSVADGIWHFVVIVYDGSDYKCYIDGVLDKTSTAYSSLNITDATFYHAQYRGGGGFRYPGDTAHVFIIHGTALNVGQINQIMRFPGSITNNLKLYWPLWGTSSPEPDLSGNGNNGTVTGAIKGTTEPPINGIFQVPRPHIIGAS